MNYEQLTEDLLGYRLRSELKALKLHSVYAPESAFFKRCFEALLKVEHECIQELVYDLARREVPGDFAEFGIFKGAWIKRMFEMTEEAGLKDRRVIGFDSFEGLSAPHPEHDISFWKKGMYSAGVMEVRKNVQADKRPRIRLIEGFFSDSLPRPESQALGPFAFARIDCDIYEPTRECLKYLAPRLSHGAILVFDDWTHDFEKGEGRAFFEWLDSVPNLKFRFLFLGPWDHLHLRVLHRDKPDDFDKEGGHVGQLA